MHGSGDGGTRRRVPAATARSAASTADASNSAGIPEEGRFRPSGSSNVLGEQVPGSFGRMSAMQGPGMGPLMGQVPQQPIVWQPWGYHTYAGPWHQAHVVNSSIPPWTPQNVLSDIQEVHAYGRGPIVAPSRPPLPAQLLWGQAEAGQSSAQQDQQVLTFIIQNIPARCTPHRLLQLFQPARDGIDFLYLPFRFRQKRSSRYAFVNFRSTSEAARFRSRWEGAALSPSDRPLVFGPAKTQGLAANMYLHAAGRERERSIEPVVFYNGEEVSFEWAWACLVRTLSEADWELVVQEANKTSAGEASASQGGCGSRVVLSL